MNLPVLFPSMKHNDIRANSHSQISPLEEFGLGIQVFKIDSTKAAEQDRRKPRQMMKHIENPMQKTVANTQKKPHILPSLSLEKHIYQPQVTKQRQTTVEKKKPSYGQKLSRENDEKKPIEKKPSWGQSQKSGQPEQNVTAPTTILAVKEKQIVEPHFRGPLNQLNSFYALMEDAQTQNEREIKRLKREGEEGEEIRWRLQCKNDRKCLVEEIVQDQDCFF